MSLPKAKFGRTDVIDRQGSDAQQSFRSARSGVYMARPFRGNISSHPLITNGVFRQYQLWVRIFAQAA